jgi:palmitoyltransferase
MAEFDIKTLAVPSVCILISFLAYSSQLLFLYSDPGTLTSAELFKFNAFVLCIWICYLRACTTSPGGVPSEWTPQSSSDGMKNEEEGSEAGRAMGRWCRKCEVLKPPRAHHCKICGRFVWLMLSTSCTDQTRCIPKMDHHCPWTNNCVSHFTFPHFVRFLFYAVASMAYLQYFLYVRIAVIWNNRSMPSVSLCVQCARRRLMSCSTLGRQSAS